MLSSNANKVVESFLDDNIPLEHLLLEWNTWTPQEQYQAFAKVILMNEVKGIQLHGQVRDRILEIVQKNLAGHPVMLPQKRN